MLKTAFHSRCDRVSHDCDVCATSVEESEGGRGSKSLTVVRSKPSGQVRADVIVPH